MRTSRTLATIVVVSGLLVTVFAAVCPAADQKAAPSGPAAPAAAPRNDDWIIIGPGGGGAQFYPTISPADPKRVFVRCDMTGGYVTLNGGESWRMFCLRTGPRWYVWDPTDADVAYASAIGLYRTRDAAKTWELIFPAPSTVTNLVNVGDHAGPNIVTDPPTRESIAALAVDPADSKTLYAVIQTNPERAPRLESTASAQARSARAVRAESTDARPAAGGRPQGGFSAPPAPAIFAVSTDWGDTWTRGEAIPAPQSGGRGSSRKIYVDPSSPKDNRAVYVVGAAVDVLRDGKWTHRAGPEGVRGISDCVAGFVEGSSEPTVYAMTSSALFVSDDGGATWRDATGALMALAAEGAEVPSLRAVGTCLSDGRVGYLSVSRLRGKGDAQTSIGIMKTTDAGKTWTFPIKDVGDTASPNVANCWMNDFFGPHWGENPLWIGVAPTDPDVVYTTDLGRTMRSTDGLKTQAGAYSKNVGDRMWTTRGLDVTTNYGVHWDPFDSRSMFISYTDIGLWRSPDGGATWTICGVPDEWQNTTYWMVFDGEVKGRAWAVMCREHDLPRPKMFRNDGGDPGFNGGVAISEDSGKTFVRSMEGMSLTGATHIILDPKSPKDSRTLYVAGFGTGAWKSTDGGKSWTLKNNGISGEFPFAWRFTVDKDGVIYLVVARRSEDGNLDPATDGAVYRTSDGAENWEPVNLPEGVNGPNGLAIDPEDPKRMYLAVWGRSNRGGNNRANDTHGGIFLTTDGGETWKNVLGGHYQHVYDVTIDPRNPNTLYACGFESSVLRSDDRGETWRRIKGFNFKWGHRVIPDPFNAGKIFVTTFGGSVWYGPADGDGDAPEDIVTPAVAYSTFKPE